TSAAPRGFRTAESHSSSCAPSKRTSMSLSRGCGLNARKFIPAAITGLMLIPIAFLTCLLVAEKDRGIVAAQSETYGLEYVLPLSKAARLAALHRGLSFGYLNGNRLLLPRMRDAQEQLDK